MRKNFSYISIVVGILIIGIMSGIVYRTVDISNSQTILKAKTFHATVLAESEIDIEISKNTHIDGITEETQTIGHYAFVVLKDITTVGPSLKRVTVKVFFDHLGKSYSVEYFSNMKGAL